MAKRGLRQLQLELRAEKALHVRQRQGAAAWTVRLAVEYRLPFRAPFVLQFMLTKNKVEK